MKVRKNKSNETIEEYLIRNKGKGSDNITWHDVGDMFGISGENARGKYRRLRALKEIPNGSNIKLEKKNTSKIVKVEETIKDGGGSLEKTFVTDVEIKTLEDLILHGQIDTDVWNIDKYIQNYWNGNWQVKAFLSPKTIQENFTNKFIEFLKDYKFDKKVNLKRSIGDSELPNGCLIINKQDIHWNKASTSKQLSMDEKFEVTYDLVFKHLEISKLSNNVDKIYYIVGSDEFNSEWTGMTTRGTPQQNVSSYEQSFQDICDYEVAIISNLYENTSADIEVIYIPGNHDEYVGWHLIHFLKTYFNKVESIEFDISTDYTKYRRYEDNALMFNHGDAIAPAKLVNIFPVEFRSEWNLCNNFYIFIGDKHHNHYKDFNGIEFYQLPAMSSSKSKWDSKNGYISKGQLVSFVLNKFDGIVNILRNRLDS